MKLAFVILMATTSLAACGPDDGESTEETPSVCRSYHGEGILTFSEAQGNNDASPLEMSTTATGDACGMVDGYHLYFEPPADKHVHEFTLYYGPTGVEPWRFFTVDIDTTVPLQGGEVFEFGIDDVDAKYSEETGGVISIWKATGGTFRVESYDGDRFSLTAEASMEAAITVGGEGTFNAAATLSGPLDER